MWPVLESIILYRNHIVGQSVRTCFLAVFNVVGNTLMSGAWMVFLDIRHSIACANLWILGKHLLGFCSLFLEYMARVDACRTVFWAAQQGLAALLSSQVQRCSAAGVGRGNLLHLMPDLVPVCMRYDTGYLRRLCIVHCLVV